MYVKVLLKDFTAVAINTGLSTTCDVQKNMSFHLYTEQYVHSLQIYDFFFFFYLSQNCVVLEHISTIFSNKHDLSGQNVQVMIQSHSLRSTSTCKGHSQVYYVVSFFLMHQKCLKTCFLKGHCFFCWELKHHSTQIPLRCCQPICCPHVEKQAERNPY